MHRVLLWCAGVIVLLIGCMPPPADLSSTPAQTKPALPQVDKMAITASQLNNFTYAVMVTLMDSISIGATTTEVEQRVAQANARWLSQMDKTIETSPGTFVRPTLTCKQGKYSCSYLSIGFYDWGLYLTSKSESQYGKTEHYEIACKFDHGRYTDALLNDAVGYDLDMFWKNCGEYKAAIALTFGNGQLESKYDYRSSWTR